MTTTDDTRQRSVAEIIGYRIVHPDDAREMEYVDPYDAFDHT